MIGLFAIGAVAQLRWRSREGDPFPGYLALFLTLMAFVLITVAISGARFNLWWYASRFLYATSYVALLFGLLQEGYSLFGAERLRAEERERLLAQLRNINEQLVLTSFREKDQAEQLAFERQRLETIVETAPIGVVVVDAESRAVLANRSAEFLLAAPKEQIGVIPPMGYSVYRHAGEPYPIEELPLIRALRHGETSFGAELVVTRPDGRTVHLLANGASALMSERAFCR